MQSETAAARGHLAAYFWMLSESTTAWRLFLPDLEACPRARRMWCRRESFAWGPNGLLYRFIAVSASVGVDESRSSSAALRAALAKSSPELA